MYYRDMENNKALTTKDAILIACDPMRPRWMRELGSDLSRMVGLLAEAKELKRSAAVIESIENDIESLRRQIDTSLDDKARAWLARNEGGVYVSVQEGAGLCVDRFRAKAGSRANAAALKDEEVGG